MTATTDDNMHTITMDALKQLGKNRAGRAWIRSSVKMWERQSVLHREQASKLDDMAAEANDILAKHNAEKEKEHDGGDEDAGRASPG